MNYVQLIGAGLLSLALVACGGGGSASLTDGTTPPPVTPPPTTPPPVTPPPSSVSLRVMAAGTELPQQMVPGDRLTLNTVEVSCQNGCPSGTLFTGLRLAAVVIPSFGGTSRLLVDEWTVTMGGKPVAGTLRQNGAGSYDFVVSGGGVPFSPGTITSRIKTNVGMSWLGFAEEISLSVLTTPAVTPSYEAGAHGNGLRIFSMSEALAVDSSPAAFKDVPRGELGYISMPCPTGREQCVLGTMDIDVTGLPTGFYFTIHVNDATDPVGWLVVTNEMKVKGVERIFMRETDLPAGATYRISFRNANPVYPTGELRVLFFGVGSRTVNKAVSFQPKDCSIKPLLARTCED